MGLARLLHTSVPCFLTVTTVERHCWSSVSQLLLRLCQQNLTSIPFFSYHTTYKTANGTALFIGKNMRKLVRSGNLFKFTNLLIRRSK